MVIEQGYFGLSFLAANQRHLSELFTTPHRPTGLAAKQALGENLMASGAPLISGALSTIECVVQSAHLVGDHYVLFSQVRSVYLGEPGLKPLIFHRSSYTTISEAEMAS